MAEGHGDEFQRGRTLGETESTLAEHSAHLTRINGSMDRVAAELHDLVLGIQRLGDAADADRATAISLAAANPELDRLLLWSAESMGSLRSAATGLRKTASALTTYARKLLRPETWKKILSGKVQTGMVTQALVKHETRSADEAKREDTVLRLFRSFRSPVLFVFGGSDPDASGSSRAYADYCTANRIPHTQHTVA